jgi:ubiquinone/menaquinone biosynthesis C-methylase UbiE
MNSSPKTNADWGSSFRLTASEKWKAKSAAMGRDVTEALVDYAHPQPGMKVLDVASGTGEPAITLASRIGPTGHVTATDLSADLLEIAAERARQRGFEHVSTQQADAQSLPFEESRFDLATSRFGVMFFPDTQRAFRELHRVLKPGARACVAVWGSKDQPYFATTIGTVHRHVGGPLIPSGGADPFRFAAEGSLSEVFKKAGFADIHEETRVVPWTWPGPPEEVWEQQQAVAAPFHPLLKRVPAEQWPALNAEIHAAIRKYQDGDALKFSATIVLASGRKP